MFSWVFVGAMFLLCATLGLLQYRWLGEVSVADRERMASTLRSSLYRISQDFNSEVTTAAMALIPPAGEDEEPASPAAYAERYREWKRTTAHGRIFRRVGVVTPHRNGGVELQLLDLDRGTFSAGDWPREWGVQREYMEASVSREPGQDRFPPPRFQPADNLVFDLPRLMPRPPEPGGPDGRQGGPFGRRPSAWLVVEFDPQYLTATMLPDLLVRHLGAAGRSEYSIQVVGRAEPRQVLWAADAGQAAKVIEKPDAQIGLAEMRFDQIMRAVYRAGGFDRDRRRVRSENSFWKGDGKSDGKGDGKNDGGPARGFGGPDMGRLQLLVQHRAGSLDAVVAAARRRNLAVTGAILLLMLASAFALIRFTTSAQRLAEMQMNFVAGVSHELRTPLTVIHTAAYNLRGAMARNPEKVERYGALIHQESERLGRLVEQVLRFANVNAGRIIRDPRPTSVEEVIEDAMDASRAELAGVDAAVETRIDPGLPLVMGDSLALKHALQNLLSNAAKYGLEGGKWIGVYAVATGGSEAPAVEVRVADRGPGIPPDEQKHVFDPFFRGRQAVRDQIHGTGLGLNLVKKIIEAHGGTVRVSSEVMKGTEFILNIPAAPPEQQDEFTNTAGRG